MNEIGSEFSLDPSALTLTEANWSKFFPDSNRIYLSTGRDSIVYAIRAHKIRKMLVPAYIEDHVIEQIRSENVEINFYKINSDLSVDLFDIEKKAKENDSLLIIHYFGFPQSLDEINSLCKSNRLLLVEDCVQAMLSSYHKKPLGSYGAISFNSLRKFMAIPDGSILTSDKKTNIFESRLHEKFIKKRLEALVGKHSYLSGVSNYSRYYFKDAFVKADVIINKYKKPAPMSHHSHEILKRTALSSIIKKRKSNFRFLMSELRDMALFQKLPNNVCPLVFPIIVNSREKIRNNLIKNKIYPPIHWILPRIINKKNFSESWKISDHILSIPIDQRYGDEDMHRIAKVLKAVKSR